MELGLLGPSYQQAPGIDFPLNNEMLGLAFLWLESRAAAWNSWINCLGDNMKRCGRLLQ